MPALSFMPFVFAYLLMGIATMWMAWTKMPDEIEMSLALELDDDAQLPMMRIMLSAFFVLSWPMLLVEVLRKR